MANSRVITMRFNDTLLSQIDAKAEEEATDRSTWVRGVIMEALGQTPPPPKPKIPGKAKETSKPPPTSEAKQEPLLPPEPDGPCPHPDDESKKIGFITICTRCGSRL